MKIILNGITYEVIVDKDQCFDKELVEKKCTDFFVEYDYIVGDYASDVLRLKGFYDKHKSSQDKIKNYNDYADVLDYLKNNCNYGCKYFILEKSGLKED